MKHAPTDSRKRRIDATARRAKDAEAAAEAINGLLDDAARPNAAWIESAPELLAIGLSINDDPAVAARLVGLDLPPAELAIAAEEARTKHEDLRERRTSAIGARIGECLELALIRLRCTIPEMSAGQVAQLPKVLAQTLELIQGTTQPAYSTITIVAKAPDGSTWTVTPPP